MVDRSNVSDPAFVKYKCDVRQEDVRRDLNAEDQAIRDAVIDFFDGEPFIGTGLLVENGAGADTFKVTAGRARDCNGRHIVVPVAVDNIPCVDNTGDYNYIAIRHVWTYENADAAVKTGLAYFRQRSEGYEINVALVGDPRDETEGWVRLALARKIGAVWHYYMERYASAEDYPRSATGAAGTFFGRTEALSLGQTTEYFSVLGAPMAGVLMDRHGIPGGPPGAPTGDIWPVPFDLLVCRVEVRARVAGAAFMNVDLWQNGAVHPNWPPGLFPLPFGDLNAVWYNPEGITPGNVFMQYYKNDLIQVELTSAGFPTDITVLISGIITGNI